LGYSVNKGSHLSVNSGHCKTSHSKNKTLQVSVRTGLWMAQWLWLYVLKVHIRICNHRIKESKVYLLLQPLSTLFLKYITHYKMALKKNTIENLHF